MSEQMILLSEPRELSTDFIRVEGAVSRDFDGLLTCTVLYNGVPVAYLAHPDSNYCDAGGDHGDHALTGYKPILVDGDPAQEQVFAHFLEWIGEAREGFAAKVADVQGRPYAVTVAESENGHKFTTYKQYGIHDAFDEFDDWLGEGHETCRFIWTVETAMHDRYPDEWPVPRP